MNTGSEQALSATVVTGERQAWLDYARVLLLALIVLHHSHPRIAVFDQMLVDLAMPLFFLLSGLLYNVARYRDSFTLFVRTRVTRLLVPYFAISALFYVLWLIVGRYMVGGSELDIEWWKPVVECVKGEPSTVCGTFWFVACLVSIQLLYYCLDRLLPPILILPVALLLAVVSRFLPGIGVWNMSNAMVYLPLFVIGSMLRKYRLAGNCESAAVATLALLAGCVLMYIAVTRFEYLTLPYSLLNLSAVALLSVPLTTLTMKSATRWGQVTWIENIATASLAYLAIQNYGIGVMRVVLSRIMTESEFNAALWLKPVIAVVVFIAIYPLAVIILRYVPALTGASKRRKNNNT